MEIISINIEEKGKIKELSNIATEIIKAYYDPIVGESQNKYMINKFQSFEAIENQIKDGYRYYLIISNKIKIGFMAFYPINNKMYLSKFYVHKDARGQGFGKNMMDFLINETKKEKLGYIFLNVNKYNSDSINIYKHLGFKKIYEEKNDIGNGYFMDDYVLELKI